MVNLVNRNMKKYYNSTTKEWYTEGNSITKNISNGVFSGIPSEQRLTEWGFEEYIEPTPTPEELLARAKASKIAELEAYDDSEVNSFSVNGKDMWLDHDVRQQLRISLDALSQAGRENVTKWFDGVEYTYPIDVWYYMLGQVEVYASDALNVTEAHKSAINALESIEDVETYEFRVNYPEKLAF